ncbi:hypothetical protein M758_4G103900 [Ceratodon purpureus]|nr:hypothetical protein M758_4G103900 [Ceratodon purpureus]
MGLLSLPFGIVRTLISVVKTLILKNKAPLRIDLPFPFIPLDIVFISDVTQFHAATNDPSLDHLHRIPTKSLPRWAQWYFSGTHFHNAPRDKWFLAFESTTCPAYTPRRAAHDQLLASEYTPDDVHRVAALIRANADEDAIADAVGQMVIGRSLLSGREIPPSIIQSARHFLRPQITDALIPGHHAASKQAQEVCYQWVAATGTPPGLDTIDVVHAFGSVITKMASAITTLRNNSLDIPVETLFTRAKNAPTPTTPRIFLQKSTLNGALSYPAVPEKTVVLLNNGKAAEASGDLFFTLGAGQPRNRVCAFKDYFEHFMRDLQTELRSPSPAAGLSSTR